MRLLDRYLLRELLVPFGYCLSGFLILWISSDLFGEMDEFLENKVKAAQIARYYVVRAPEFLTTVFPISLLLALLYSLTNHARHHELTAIRAAGVSLWRLCLPYLGVGLVSTLLMFAMNELLVPDSVDTADRIKAGNVETSADAVARRWHTNLFFVNSRDNRQWQIGVYNRDTHEMIKPNVAWTLPNGFHREFLAERATHENGAWTFHELLILTYTNRTSAQPLREVKDSLAVPEFSETPAQINSQIKITRQYSKKRFGNAEIPLANILAYLRLHPDLADREADRLFSQLHGRLAAPWTCLVVVLIAIPFGARSGRRNVFVGVAASIVICFTYFVLLRLGLALGAGGFVPPWLGAWFPNLSFGIAGIWLTSRVR